VRRWVSAASFVEFDIDMKVETLIATRLSTSVA
jgi:hypothetical protein